MRTKEIKKLLRAALLQDGKMDYGLYEYDMEEHIDYWYAGLQQDQDEFVFAVNENTGHVAMVLITPDKTVYINEEACAKLKAIWSQAYQPNMKRLIPMMAEELAHDIMSVTGVKTIKD
jgi:exoribonuclease II